MGMRIALRDAWDALRGRERANPVVGASYDRLSRQWGVGDAWAKPTYGEYYPASVSVYAAIKLRQEAIASVPAFVYAQSADGLEQVADDHPLQRLLNRVNQWWTRGDLWRATETYLGIWGSAYWALTREGTEITEIWPLRPDKMKILPDPQEYIRGYVYGSGTERVAFTPDEIVWFRYFNPLDEYSGLSPIAPVRLSVDMGVDALKANRFALANDASPGMIISVSDTPTDEEVMSFYDRWEHRFRGPERSRRPAILGEGMTASNLGFSPKDMMALESMRWSVEDVARVYNVPMPMLHDLSRATYANIMTARKSFWEDCIVPQLRFYEEELTELLVPLYGEPGLVVRFDTSNVPALQEDEDSKSVRRERYVKLGILTINEVRDEMGMEDVPWGDEPVAPMSPPMLMPEPEAEPETDVEELPPTGDDGERARWGVRDWEERGRAVDATQRHKGARLEAALRRDLSVLLRKQANQIIREFEEEAEAYGRVAVNGQNGVAAVAEISAERQPIFRPTIWIPEFTTLIRRHLTIAVLSGAETQIEEHKLGTPSVVQAGAVATQVPQAAALDFDLTASPVKGWIENRSRWWAQTINDGTEKRLFKVLSDGRTQGLSSDDIAKNLRKMREFQTTVRSERVARTEITVAQGQGGLEAFKQAEVPAKQWYTALDERVRETHMAAHGQIRAHSEQFTIGSDRMDSPGQGSQAGENVNCRCVILPVGLDDG